MTREEKEQLSRERFLKGQEIHRQRELEREFYKKRYEEAKKSIEETDNLKLSISLVALDLLEELGFDRMAKGTDYLAEIIEILYHERKIFDGNNSFFDFNDKRNNHYSFANEYFECGLKNLHKAIEEEIAKSYVSDSSMNDIVYNVANDLISQYDRCCRKLILESID